MLEAAKSPLMFPRPWKQGEHSQDPATPKSGGATLGWRALLACTDPTDPIQGGIKQELWMLLVRSSTDLGRGGDTGHCCALPYPNTPSLDSANGFLLLLLLGTEMNISVVEAGPAPHSVTIQSGHHCADTCGDSRRWQKEVWKFSWRVLRA